jgi:hypothetical protein
MRLTKQGFCKLRGYDRLVWFVDHVKMSSSVFRSGIVLMIRALTPNPPPGDTALFFASKRMFFIFLRIADFEMSESKFDYFSGYANTKSQKAARYECYLLSLWLTLFTVTSAPHTWQYFKMRNTCSKMVFMLYLQVDSSAGKVQFCRKIEREEKSDESEMTSEKQKQQYSLICEVQLHLKVLVTHTHTHQFIHQLFELCVVAGSIWWVELLQTPQLPNASKCVFFLIVSAAASPKSTNPWVYVVKILLFVTWLYIFVLHVQSEMYVSALNVTN